MAFYIFPVEVWSEILDRVQDSATTQNTIRAFPELRFERDIKVKLAYWIFEQVFPLLCEYLDNNNAKYRLRQVCYRWKGAVDSFIQNHRDHRPFPSTFEEDASRSTPIYEPFRYYIVEHFGLFQSFDSIPEIWRFVQDMGNTNYNTNPFPQRGLSLTVEAPFPLPALQVDNEEELQDNRGVWGQFSDFVTIYGRGLFYLWLEGLSWDHVSFTYFVLSCMEQCPYLRSLRLIVEECPEGYENEYDVEVQKLEKIMSNLSGELIICEKLESLDISCPHLPIPLLDYLISAYENKIRKLELNGSVWRHCQAKSLNSTLLFPNLTDIAIYAGLLDEIVGILGGLVNPHYLGQITIDLSVAANTIESRAIILTDIVPMLSRFMRLKSFRLFNYGGCVREWPRPLMNPNGQSIKVSSVTQLSICISSISTDMALLECFPRLKYMQVCSPHKRSFFLNNRQLWEQVCKGLKVVTVLDWNVNRRHQRQRISRVDFDENVRNDKGVGMRENVDLYDDGSEILFELLNWLGL